MWETTKGQQRKLGVNDIRMLRWMCGVTKKDKIRNVKGTVKVESMAKKIMKKRMKWYGHSLRISEEMPVL